MPRTWLAPFVVNLYQPGIERTADGYRIGPGAVTPGLLGSGATRILVVGNGATVQGDISHPGRVVLCKGVRVQGKVYGGTGVVVGATVQVQGDVRSEGTIIVQSGAWVEGAVQTLANAYLLGTSQVGNVVTGGDILIHGSPQAGELRPEGRIRTL